MSGEARIRRGTGGATRRTAAPAKRKAKRPPPNAAAASSFPVSGRTLRRAGNFILGGLIAAGIVTGIMVMQLPQMIGTSIGEGIGAMGFAVRNVEVRGRAQMDRDAVLSIAMDQKSQAMPLVDLEGTRQRLLGLGWVGDARVSRRLPDTLVVDIVERKPTAIWQYQGRLALVDDSGALIAPVDLAAMPDLPIVIGAGANRQVGQLDLLMAQVPAMKPMLAGATWVSGRRWDLRFQSGEVLALPEGHGPAVAALKDFARRDSEYRLLGQGFVRFDMRVPGRIVVRVSREPGKSITDGAAAPPNVKNI